MLPSLPVAWEEADPSLAASPDEEPPVVSPPVVEDTHLDTLVSWMTGAFSSAAQAAEDPTYFDIRLFVAPIWTDRDDGRWMYVEQAAAAALERPYRQRVYRVRHVGRDLYESQIYSLPDAKAAIGAWKLDTPLAEVTPDQLTKLEGCAVILRRLDDGSFRGSTLGSACTNSFGKASYATSEVTLREDGMVSWDRGYDDTHAQVWGAEKAGYRFLKVEMPAK